MTPIPSAEANAADATPSSIAFTYNVVAFPVVPSWIDPTMTIAPVQKRRELLTKPSTKVEESE
jgi:hypothetical protein